MKTVSKVLSCIFGYLCLGLSTLVCVEVFARKVLSMSLQGADELGGYILAVGSCMAFCVALIGRNHMRIDIFHYRLPEKIQAILNWVAIMTLALFGLLLAATGFGVIRDTFLYHSTAPTPWATPLIYPQGAWYAGLFMFAVTGVILAFRATKLLLGNRLKELQSDFQPKAAAEELEEELENAANR
ncbi:MAG: TRAP transporter small permease [Thermodesulfobacteriota bacterium]